MGILQDWFIVISLIDGHTFIWVWILLRGTVKLKKIVEKQQDISFVPSRQSKKNIQDTHVFTKYHFNSSYFIEDICTLSLQNSPRCWFIRIISAATSTDHLVFTGPMDNTSVCRAPFFIRKNKWFRKWILIWKMNFDLQGKWRKI